MNKIALLKPLFNRWWFHFILVLAVCAVAAHDFFIVGNYLNLPAYYDADTDADPMFAAQTILLLNDGDGYFFYHPGGTVYMLQGIVNHTLALFNDEYRNLFHLTQFSIEQEAWVLLTTAVAAGRVIALVSVFVITAALYCLALKLTGSWLVSLLFTFYVATTHSIIMHSHIIRTDSLSVGFYFVAALLCLTAVTSQKQSLYRLLLQLFGIGLALGLAILSKIQIIPAIALLLVPAILLMPAVYKHPIIEKLAGRNVLAINVALSFTVVLLTPYWSITRPAFLTHEVLHKMSPDLQRLYGTIPHSHQMPISAALAILIAFSCSIVLLKRQGVMRIIPYLSTISLTINMAALGIIASVYIVLLPASVSFDGYISNTNHLVYATLTNVAGTLTNTSHGGFLENTQGKLQDYLENILRMHHTHSPILGMNPLYIVAGSILFPLGRLIWPARQRRVYYLLSLWFFTIGIVMDLLSAMRWTTLYPQYAIYSIGFYGLGLAYLTSTELTHIRTRSWQSLLGIILLVFMVAHSVITGYSRLSRYAGSVAASGSAEQGWYHIRLLVPQFVKLLEYREAKKRVAVFHRSTALLWNV